MEDNKDLKTAIERLPSTEEQDKNRRKRKTARAALSFGIMALLLAILFLAAVNIGSLKVSFPQLFRGIFLEPDETVSTILISVSKDHNLYAGGSSGGCFRCTLSGRAEKSPGGSGNHRYFQRRRLCSGDHYGSGPRLVFLYTPFCLSGRSPWLFFLVYTLSGRGD